MNHPLDRTRSKAKSRSRDSCRRVVVEVYVPDRRKRDLDNLHKGILDSLTHAGVWGDDSQIDDLRIYRAR
jgi:Holliday junction resolvase RusA-like endonuclease